jgi:polyhydroxyalkanoate depolymerase
VNIYPLYNARRVMTAPIYATAELQGGALRWLENEGIDHTALRGWRALCETVSALKLTHERPEFGIDTAEVDGTTVPVIEERVASTPFGSLVHFAKPGVEGQPRVLAIPGLAGHFATLVRGTVSTLLRDFDVYVADWHNARDVPVDAGRFGLEEYIEHLTDFMEVIGPDGHIIALCQPVPATLAAAALMAEDGNPAQPVSITLMAGPVDARVNPGRVNRWAEEQSLETLERRLISTVSWPYKGAGRRVYPGVLQAMGFLGLDPKRHVSVLATMAKHYATGEKDAAAKTRDFYEEYFAVLDVTAEFYLETARAVFMDHDLARGVLHYRGRLVDPSKIETALLTIEGAKDEMCPPGQTAAAHDLCTGIPVERRHHHVQEGVGHYGVFSGSRFERDIYPRVRSFILNHGEMLKAVA